jgi:hypothetical protein
MRWAEKWWAAKKVVKLGSGATTADCDALESETICSLIVLKRLECFYTKFVKFVAEKRLSSSITGWLISIYFTLAR